jgi:MFS transporter, DHA3 family, tetracycline resistance protein
VGIGLAVGLANLALGLPLMVAGLLQVALAGWLALAMPETGFEPAPRGERSTWWHMAATARDGLASARRDRVLLGLFAVALLTGLSTEGVDRLWQLHLLREIGIPDVGHVSAVTWFGLIELASLVLGAVVIAPARRRVDTGDQRALCRLLLWLTVVEAATVAVLGLTGGFVMAVAALLVYGGTRGLREPLYDAWVVPLIEPRVRATVLSAIGQADAVGQVLGGPAIGLVATLVTPGIAIVAAGSALVPVAVVLARLRKRVGAPGAGV